MLRTLQEGIMKSQTRGAAECPTFFRRQKKNYHATLSDEDTDDTEDDSGMSAFTTCFTEIDLGDDSGCSDEDLTFEELKMFRKEDTELKLKEVQNDYDQKIKSVKMLNSGTENLDSILKSGQNSSSKYGLGFDASVSSLKSTSEVKFAPALGKAKTETTLTTTIDGPPAKSPRRICYYCG
ncbi:gag-pol polyprotein [Cucumis melo var. makuwa]|uniref:Gag-pol polyprotein n=1 Tax=Cucumis melo var. makuwa TaxID=1194695 RepID=A0A5D3BR57_CUCMM|nr:gag-pol polyprotein [Cucumis melo var. makuwa]